VVVSGKSHGPTADGGSTYDFLLVTNHRLLASTVNYDGWNARPPGSDGGGLDIRPIPNPQQQGDVAPQAAIVNRGGDGEGDGDGGEDHGGQTVPWVAQQVYNGWAANTAVNYTWMAVTTAYRRTGDSLTLAGTEYPIYAVVDSFSHVLTHQGQPTTFVHTMDADGLTQVGNGVYTLLVPSGGQVVAKVKYSTEPLPAPTLADKLDQIEDTVETAVQQAASKADAIEDAVERVIKPGQHES
jgi:hypothetical protein